MDLNESLNQRILAVVPHVEIMAYPNEKGTSSIKPWQPLVKTLAQHEQIDGISPYVTFTALVENGTKLKVVQVKGVEKSAQDQVSALGQFVLDEGWKVFEQQSGLILGYGIARELDVVAGDWVSLLISPPNEQNQLAQPIRHRIQVSGILRLEGQLDHSYALLPLTQAQTLLGISTDEVHGVELKVKQPFQSTNINVSDVTGLPASPLCTTLDS